MLFNSYAFVFLYLPVCLIVFYLCRALYGEKKPFVVKGALLLLSLWFYGFMDIRNVPVLIGSMAINYGIYKRLTAEKASHRKGTFLVGLAVNLLILFGFKYTGAVFVPLGISFFTFSQIAFLMEAYRGDLQEISLLDYGIYVSFFPKLLEGPIALPKEFLSQVSGACRARINPEQVYRGLLLFILGLAKKVLLADTLGAAVDFGYANLAALNSVDAVIVMLSYTLQIYFDFSGYCDMAMGIARCLSFELPLNFDQPYRAADIMEFWKGWHMTLTHFFTKYLYIPLGGNRKGKGRTYLNTLIVFLVSGIWHGAGIQFLVWGLLHGSLYVVTRFLRDHGKKIKSVFLTFLFVNFAWIFFRAPSLGEAGTLIKAMFRMKFSRLNWNLAGCFNVDEFWYVIKLLHIDRWQYAHYILMAGMLLIALLLVFAGRRADQLVEKIRPGVLPMVIFAGIFVWCIISFSGVSSFIYLNF